MCFGSCEPFLPLMQETGSLIVTAKQLGEN